MFFMGRRATAVTILLCAATLCAHETALLESVKDIALSKIRDQEAPITPKEEPVHTAEAKRKLPLIQITSPKKHHIDFAFDKQSSVKTLRKKVSLTPQRSSFTKANALPLPLSSKNPYLPEKNPTQLNTSTSFLPEIKSKSKSSTLPLSIPHTPVKRSFKKTAIEVPKQRLKCSSHLSEKIKKLKIAFSTKPKGKITHTPINQKTENILESCATLTSTTPKPSSLTYSLKENRLEIAKTSLPNVDKQKLASISRITITTNEMHIDKTLLEKLSFSPVSEISTSMKVHEGELLVLAEPITETLSEFETQLELPVSKPLETSPLPSIAPPPKTTKTLRAPKLPYIETTKVAKKQHFLAFAPVIERLSDTTKVFSEPKLEKIASPNKSNTPALALNKLNEEISGYQVAPTKLKGKYTKTLVIHKLALPARKEVVLPKLPTTTKPFLSKTAYFASAIPTTSLTPAKEPLSKIAFSTSSTKLAIATHKPKVEKETILPTNSFIALNGPKVVSEAAPKEEVFAPNTQDLQKLQAHSYDLAIEAKNAPSLSSLSHGEESVALKEDLLNEREKALLPKKSDAKLLDQVLAHTPEIPKKQKQTPSSQMAEELTLDEKQALVALPQSYQSKSELPIDAKAPLLTENRVEPLSKNKAQVRNKHIRKSDENLSNLPSFVTGESIPFYNEFTPEVFVTKRDDGEGYYFAITMRPKSNLSLTPPAQNIVFIVDKSSSIKKHRFEVYRQGVLKSLSYLKAGDTFNIITADAKLRELSPEPLPVSENTVRRAKEFLHKETFSGFFDSYAPVNLFDKVHAMAEKNPDMNVIWLTNGSGLKDIKKERLLLRSMKSLSKGKFTLYTATAAGENKLAMLDLIANYKQGELLYTQTHASFPRQLAILTKKISNTVATDIHLAARRSKANIELFTRTGLPPHLTKTKPYTIYGSTDDLEDFELLIQGQVAGQEIDIRQDITFDGAKPATHKMKNHIAAHQAFILYDSFIKEGKTIYLDEAKMRLAPFATPTPFK